MSAATMEMATMDITTIDVHEAQLQLLQLLALIQQGRNIVIAKDNVPQARLVPIRPQKKQRVADLHPGAMRMSSDFNDPLPDEFWLGE